MDEFDITTTDRKKFCLERATPFCHDIHGFTGSQHNDPSWNTYVQTSNKGDGHLEQGGCLTLITRLCGMEGTKMTGSVIQEVAQASQEREQHSEAWRISL
ncbi:hypothetical protein WISP_119395 [Willisornis vidua]|uniref:Uncharacterized protein n=1 Tax=Willisornis vidua TaxID=1566151 RepID=A0ABQ9CY00_9PASS|nr:hypothetical protein WISP_119395 [Willisornis vidua]